MNKILDDYIGCVRKRLLTDQFGSVASAADVIARGNWDILVNTASRTIIRDNPPLREALLINGLDKIEKDKDLRKHLEEEAERNG